MISESSLYTVYVVPIKLRNYKKLRLSRETKELDIVRLTASFNDFPVWTEGTIVLEYDGNNFDVEFFDSNCATIGEFSATIKVLELVTAG